METPTIINHMQDIGSVIWKHTRKMGRNITISADSEVIEALRNEFNEIAEPITIADSKPLKDDGSGSFCICTGGNYFYFIVEEK